MKRLIKGIDVAYHKLTKEDYDNLWIIEGEEGIGKSNLGLWALDYWCFLLGNKATKEDIRYICPNMLLFVKELSTIEKHKLIVYDEGGELSNLRIMDKFNYMLSRSYKKIRGFNLFTIIILPSVFDLNPYFVRRARGLISVYKRGKFAYWGKEKLRTAIQLNQYYKRKSIWRVPPLFYDTFSKYDGILKEPYLERKKEDMENDLKNLYEELFGDKSQKSLENLRIIQRLVDKVGLEEASLIWGKDKRTLYRNLKKIRDIDSLT